MCQTQEVQDRGLAMVMMPLHPDTPPTERALLGQPHKCPVAPGRRGMSPKAGNNAPSFPNLVNSCH